MSDWPIVVEGGRVQDGCADTSTSAGTTVTASSSTNTKGSYVQLNASLGFDCDGFFLALDGQGSTVADLLLDLAIGAASSELVILPNLHVSLGSWPIPGAYQWWPIGLKAGTRISARAQSTTGSLSVVVQFLPVSHGFAGLCGYGRVTDYAANTSDSGGVGVDPGAASNTLGAWTQLTASTTNPIRALVVGWGDRANTAETSANFLMEIGVGGAGSEKVLLTGMRARTGASTDTNVIKPDLIGPLAAEVPAGTRLSVRCASSTTDATDRLIDAFCWGID